MFITQLTFCMKNPTQYILVRFDKENCKVECGARTVIVSLGPDKEVEEVDTIKVQVLTEHEGKCNAATSGDVDLFTVNLEDVAWWTRSDGCIYPPFGRHNINNL